MKSSIATFLLLVFLGLPAALAGQLESTYEGDASKRERLSALQDSPTPPELAVAEWMNAEAMTLADLKGKIVVLDFWATWCGPCIASIPKNNGIQSKYKDKGVVIIGVCHPRGSEKMKSVVSDKGIEYAVVKDPDGKTIKAYGVNGYPDYYIIDRKGVLRVADCANSKVEDAIVALLAED